MGIISFSPVFFRPSALSILLAPVHALVAFFVPAQSASASVRQAPNPTTAPRVLAPMATKCRQNAAPTRTLRRLKVVRQFEPGANRSCTGRLVISGRMSDVCAELDRMARLEMTNHQIWGR